MEKNGNKQNPPKGPYSFFNNFVESHNGGLAVHFLAFICGSFGLGSSTDIRNSFPFRIFSPFPISSWEFDFPALFFWACAMAWAFMAYKRYKADGIKSTKLSDSLTQIKDLNKNLEAIDETNKEVLNKIQTFPPQRFLLQFSKIVTKSYLQALSDFPRENSNDQTKIQIEKWVQSILEGIARLASSYELEDARYVANVMIYVKGKESSPYFPDYKKEEIKRFLPDEYDLEFLEGILVGRRSLSAVVNNLSWKPSSLEVEQDTDLEEVIFGIPKKGKSNGRWTIPPGAPLAYCKWVETCGNNKECDISFAVQGLDNITSLRESVASGVNGEKFDLDLKVIEKIEKHYQSSSPIMSFQSFPLVELSTSERPIGVLNIHCDQTNFLGKTNAIDARKRQQDFAKVVSPMIFELASLVALWLDTAET